MMEGLDSLGLGDEHEVKVGSLVAEVREISMADHVGDGMVGDDMDGLHYWMEAGGNCDADGDHHVDPVGGRVHSADDVGIVENMVQSGCPVVWEEEWTTDGVIVLLEAYEERLGEVNNGNLKARDWEEVAALVNIHCSVNQAPVNVTQCRNKVYALRRWYKSFRCRTNPYMHDENDATVFTILDRIMTPYPYQAGIPGGIDAGERLSFPPPSMFDEEEDDNEEPAPVTDQSVDLYDNPATHLGKRLRMPEEGLPTLDAVDPQPSTVFDNGGISEATTKKAARRGVWGPSKEVAHAIKGFAKVLNQIEVAKRNIKRDLEARRSELLLKLAAFSAEEDLLDQPENSHVLL